MRDSQHPICIFDRLEALHCFCSDYHDGQWGFLYSLLGRLHNVGFSTRMSLNGMTCLTLDGLEFYRTLESKYEYYTESG